MHRFGVHFVADYEFGFGLILLYKCTVGVCVWVFFKNKIERENFLRDEIVYYVFFVFPLLLTG